MALVKDHLKIKNTVTDVKKGPPNFYKPPTRFMEVKTDSTDFYKPPTPFSFIKTASMAS